MRQRPFRAALAAALAFAAAAPGFAEGAYPDLDIEALRQAAHDYRHRAALLRRSVGLRQAGISDAESRANAALQAAQADAQARAQAAAQAQADAANAQAGAAAFGAALGFIPGMNGIVKSALQGAAKGAGNMAAANADAAAQDAASQGNAEMVAAAKAAAPLREQAQALEGEKKKLALKANQYEQLADAKDLLVAAETLRKEAETAATAAASADKTIADSRDLIRNLDLW